MASVASFFASETIAEYNPRVYIEGMAFCEIPPEDDDEKPVEKEPRALNIKVLKDEQTGEWTAAWGTKMEQTANSAATALRMLADDFEQKGKFGSLTEKLSDYRANPDTKCKYCKAPIFFAIVPSGKYLAFDVEPVDPQGLGDEKGARFLSTMQTARGSKPLVTWTWGAMSKVPLYVPHPQTCGDSIKPTAPALIDRWEANHTASAAKVSKAIDGLKSIRADMEQGIQDDLSPQEHRS